MKCTSEAQIAVLSVRNNSSPGPGTGSAVSRTSSRPPRNTTARIAAPCLYNARLGREIFSTCRGPSPTIS